MDAYAEVVSAVEPTDGGGDQGAGAGGAGDAELSRRADIFKMPGRQFATLLVLQRPAP